MNKPGLLVVLTALTLSQGCASSSRYINEADRSPAGDDLAIGQSDSLISVTLNQLVLPDGSGSWVKQAVWDEYQLTLRNLSDSPVTIESLRLIDSRGVYIERGVSPEQLVSLSEALMEEYRDIGISTAITAAPSLMVMGGGLGALSAATILMPVALVAGPAYYFGKEYMDQKDVESIQSEFNRRNISTLTFGPQATYRGSAFFPLVPNPAALVVDYRQGTQAATLTLPLDTLRGLHVADAASAAALEELSAAPTVQSDMATAVREPLTVEVITAAQHKLADQGYQPGAADGVIGNRTIAAIRQFQADRGLTVNGLLDAATLNALGQ